MVDDPRVAFYSGFDRRNRLRKLGSTDARMIDLADKAAIRQGALPIGKRQDAIHHALRPQGEGSTVHSPVDIQPKGAVPPFWFFANRGAGLLNRMRLAHFPFSFRNDSGRRPDAQTGISPERRIARGVVLRTRTTPQRKHDPLPRVGAQVDGCRLPALRSAEARKKFARFTLLGAHKHFEFDTITQRLLRR